MKRTASAGLLAGLLALASFVAPATVAANDSPCQGLVGVTGALGMPAGAWSEGEHSYTITYRWPPTEPGDPGVWTTDPVTFWVDADAPLLTDVVFLRGFGLSATPGTPVPIGDTINPGQPTVFWAGIFYAPGDYSTMKEARSYLADNRVGFAWDGGSEVAAPMFPIANGCAQGNLVVHDELHVMGQLRRHYAG